MIRFNLDKIFHRFKNEFIPPMSINNFSKDTGVSRHAINTLMKNPKGINFNTLNKLVSYFDLPVSDFISYTDDDIKIALTDSNKRPPKHKNRIVGNMTDIYVQNEHEPHGKLIMQAVPFISSKGLKVHNAFNKSKYEYLFKVILVQLNNNNGHHNELFNSFNMNLDKYIKSYIESRIVAHSGLISKKTSNNRSKIHKIVFAAASNNDQLSSLLVGLKQRYMLHPTRFPDNLMKNQSDNSIVIDYTTNNFKS